LLQTAGILAVCRAFCGNDTGSMHLAALLGIPIVGIFSARVNERQWFPFGKNNVIVHSDVPCKNCMLETCRYDPPKCLDNIPVERVLEALNAVWFERTSFSG
jgi:heptosyltransferase III